jgi:hypothetical protein
VTVAQLSVVEELEPLVQIGSRRGWTVQGMDATSFILGLPARDGSWFWLFCRCDAYPGLPPAWHWYDSDTKAVDQPRDTPTGGGFFHSSGVICAPWNRLAYVTVDPRGPHSDWVIGAWRSNEKTGGCKTLAAMALRIAVELRAATFTGRRG